MKLSIDSNSSTPVFESLHVVLKHDNAGSLDCTTPYCIGPLFLYCKSPPDNPALKLFGIYPSLNAAIAAVQVDSPYQGG